MLPVDLKSSDIHDLLKFTHILISLAFLVFAVCLITRSIIGIRKRKEYLGPDRFLAYATLITLYLQLIFGFFLFANYGPMSGYDYLGGESSRIASKRLWPIEHIVLMFFALLIATLGLILANNSKIAIEKHKKVLIYYVIAILIIAQSLCAVYLF